MLSLLAQPIWATVAGLALVCSVALVLLVVAPHWRYHNLSALVLVLGVVAIAVTVTIMQVAEYKTEQALRANAVKPASPAALPEPPPERPVPQTIPFAGAGRASGAAAPAAARNPNLKPDAKAQPGSPASSR